MKESDLTVSNLELDAQKRSIRRSWLLSTPALVVLFSAASGPLFIVLLYSFLSSGEYGGITWKFSTDAWFNVVLVRDIFDDTLRLADAHLRILWRSVKLSFFTTVDHAGDWISDCLFHCHPAAEDT
jgi:spermidine/putrescine transport system permease protein